MSSIKSLLKSFFVKLILLLLLLLILVYSIIYLLNLSNRTFNRISESFSSGQIINEFHSYITQLEGSNKLQIASIKSIDVFSKTDSKSILWDLISLPDVIVEIKAPVEYTFFIDLKEKWEFNWEEADSTIIIIAPKIKAGTPAIDVSNMEMNEKKGSILRNVEEIKANLKNELTSRLRLTANEKITLIREIARTETKNFIQNWFVKFYFKDSEFNPKKINVFFADEEPIRQFIQGDLREKQFELN